MPPRNILVSPTAFKGTLRPFEAAHTMASVVRQKWPRAQISILPLADGGDGTLDALEHSLHAKRVTTTVKGPLGKPVRATWAMVGQGNSKTALIEMARSSGLALTRGKNRVMDATSFGTGQVIAAALKKKCRRLLIGVGGTACAEGGAGALRALGLRYFNSNGNFLTEKPVNLLKISRVDRSQLNPGLKRCKIFVLCDVKNPLLGKNGSARTYGPQKGATLHQVNLLEKSLKHWASFAPKKFSKAPGAGAAGALAFGLAGFAGATLVDGTAFVLKTLRWKECVKKADLVLTGEGKIDRTSFLGKVVGEVARFSKKVPVLAVCGTSNLSPVELKRKGLERVVQMGPRGLKFPKASLAQATTSLIKDIK